MGDMWLDPETADKYGLELHNGRHGEESACRNWEPKCADYDGQDVKLKAAYEAPPEHYAGKGMDPWAIWEAFDLDPWAANVVKYICRAGKKPGEAKLKDLKKAQNYLGYLIERAEKE